jgi:23S rRNA pseudouridine1911/1915/1917 synthase
MPKPSTVEEPSELLAYLFATWPEVKRKQLRRWLKFQAVTVNNRPVTQFNHSLVPGDVVAVRSDRFAVPKTVLASGMKVYFEDAELIVIDKPENLLSVASEAERRKRPTSNSPIISGREGRTRDRVWIVHPARSRDLRFDDFREDRRGEAKSPGCLGPGGKTVRGGSRRETRR